jgi:hypothetical protein
MSSDKQDEDILRINNTQIEGPEDTASALERHSVRKRHIPEIDKLCDRPNLPVGYDGRFEEVVIFLANFG